MCSVYSTTCTLDIHCDLILEVGKEAFGAEAEDSGDGSVFPLERWAPVPLLRIHAKRNSPWTLLQCWRHRDRHFGLPNMYANGASTIYRNIRQQNRFRQPHICSLRARLLTKSRAEQYIKPEEWARRTRDIWMRSFNTV